MKSEVLPLLNYLFSGILVASFLISFSKVWAVDGISGSKVVIPNTETVEKGRFEFEPVFGLAYVDDGDDTTEFEFGVRLTLGVIERLELGTIIGFTSTESDAIDRDSDFRDVGVGLKYRFLDEVNGFPSVAFQGGVTFPTSGNSAPWFYELGAVATKNLSDQFSIDADFVGFLINDDALGLVTELGFGYFITSWFQPVIEVAYAFENPDDGNSVSVINITGGFTAPAADYLTIIMGVTTDVYTDDTDDQIVFLAAFTFLF